MSSIELGAVAVDALVGMGVSDIVLSPGSRSAALALAVDRADRAGRLRLHVRIDERVAAFTALGLAKQSGRAVAVITTSGTAVANLGPAAMEATVAGVPLLLLTADRPSHLIDTGASQTADQTGVLGASTRHVIRLSSESGDAAAWAATVQRAVVLAEGRRTRLPGAVQVNLEFAEPLVGELPEPRDLTVVTAASGGHRVVELDARRTVVLVGDATPEVGAEARALAELSGAPLLAEPSSNARRGPNAVAWYRHALPGLGGDIERVVCFGHPTLTRPVATLLARSDIELVVVSDRAGWVDPGHRAAIVADRVLLEGQDPAWLARWLAVGDAPRRTSGLTQRAVADAVLAGLGPDDDVMFGSSSIIRAADLSPIAAAPPRAFANRGVAGIDGTVATATGLALGSGRPTTVLVGDLTVQHDLGALVRPPGEPWPQLRVVVADDNGGSIFRGLEQGGPEYADSFDRVFLTPQSVDLAAVAGSLGWRAAVVTDEAGLTEALAGDAEFVVAKVTA